MAFQSRLDVERELRELRGVEKEGAERWELVAQALLVELHLLQKRVEVLEKERQGARDLGRWLREQAARFDGG